jgi:hypothetical protein
VQGEAVTGNVTVDERKKILIRCDAERMRSVLPFDLKCATGVDVRKSPDRALIGFDISVPSNSYPPTSGGQNQTRSNQRDCYLRHKNISPANTMQWRSLLDSGKLFDQ